MDPLGTAILTVPPECHSLNPHPREGQEKMGEKEPVSLIHNHEIAGCRGFQQGLIQKPLRPQPVGLYLQAVFRRKVGCVLLPRFRRWRIAVSDLELDPILTEDRVQTLVERPSVFLYL